MPSAHQLAEDLGGPAVLGVEVNNEMDMVNLIELGLPVETTDSAIRARIVSPEELADLVVPSTTLGRRKKAGRLDAPESDRLVRIMRVVRLARETLGDEKAARWMRKPNRALGGKIPLMLCRSEAGARLVEAVIGRIRYGVFS